MSLERSIDILLLFFFFFQAEDGIRDYKVTGVQTCALPILADAWAHQQGDCESNANQPPYGEYLPSAGDEQDGGIYSRSDRGDNPRAHNQVAGLKFQHSPGRPGTARRPPRLRSLELTS